MKADFEGMSYSEVARRSGLTPSYISLLMRGLRGIRMDTVERISRAVGLEPGELYRHLQTARRRARQSARRAGRRTLRLSPVEQPQTPEDGGA
jgi:transcriptional regulator with XRE-family HTH domain